MARGNLLGEPINQIILEQIDLRQQLHGSGQNNTPLTRDPQVLNYLNNRNAWIKLASGVSISGSAGEQKLIDLSNAENSYLSEKDRANVKSYGLAKNLVLFNTIQSINDYDPDLPQPYLPRSGVRQSNLFSTSIGKMYGGLGDNSRGLQPVPGITDISIECLNRGSIKKATVNIKAYNKFQFGLIELLYLRLGYMMMLEWGWDKYVDRIENNTPVIENVGSTLIEDIWFKSNSQPQSQIFKSIKGYRNQYKGNYDGFFGKVSNFSWKLNNDNTYDITLNLITTGSVIESLKVNIPTTSLTPTALKEQKEKLEKKFYGENDNNQSNPILANAGSDELNQFISSTILDFPFNNKNYCYLPNLTGKDGDNRKKLPVESRYYIQFATLLDKIQTIAVPNIVNGNTSPEPLLNFDLDVVNTKCAYELNLIPLSPSKVIFSPLFEKTIFKRLNNTPLEEFKKQLLPFAVKENDVVYGQILNCYFNLNYISQVLENNRNEKGETNLYKFLEALCSAINESTGNTTNLEPAIKDNNRIYILEQNVIKGLDSLSKNKEKKKVPFIIYGYKGKSSTFVKDFGFQTKITPDLASMITIGAAAEGSTTKNINAIPFNSWNQGLKNRFQEKLIDSPKTLKDKTGTEELTEDELVAEAFKTQILNEEAGYVSFFGKNKSRPIGYFFTYEGIKAQGIDDDAISFIKDRNADSENKNLLAEGVRIWKETRDKRKEDQLKLQQEFQDPNIKIVSKAASSSDNYFSYLANAFGGATGEVTPGEFITNKSRLVYYDKETNTNKSLITKEVSYSGEKITISPNEAKWWYLDSNSDFTQQGKNSFKLYLNQINQLDFTQLKPILSSEGFIPLDLSLTFEGLGGIKIYNKIDVDTRILPLSYPKSLKFIATKVNHKINNNTWETSINTISVPPTENVQPKFTSNSLNTSLSSFNEKPIEVKDPIPPKNDNNTLLIIDNRTVAGKPFNAKTYKDKQSVEWLIGELNLNTQNIYRKFLTKLEILYPGYTLLINTTYRSYERSKQLKENNPNQNNAKPGFSGHNYAYAIDMNVIDPNGKTFRKSDRKSWIESGIPKLAEEFGLRWGGDFSNYIDCVHFDVGGVTDVTLRNASNIDPNYNLTEEEAKTIPY